MVSRLPLTTTVPDTVTIAAGWLPAGYTRPVIATRSYGTQLRGYDIETPAGHLSVLVGSQPGTALPTSSKRGEPRDVTVAGRPGREWSVDGWYRLAVRLPQARIATVDVTGSGDAKGTQRPAAELAGIGRRVAAQLQLDRRDRIDTDFTLADVPAGLAVRGVAHHVDGGTSYSLAAPTAPAGKPARRSVDVSEATQAWRTPQGKPRPPATAGRGVQGRPTWVYRTEAGPVLWVDELRPGRSVVLSSTAPGSTLDDLYRIADGIRWTG